MKGVVRLAKGKREARLHLLEEPPFAQFCTSTRTAAPRADNRCTNSPPVSRAGCAGSLVPIPNALTRRDQLDVALVEQPAGREQQRRRRALVVDQPLQL